MIVSLFVWEIWLGLSSFALNCTYILNVTLTQNKGLPRSVIPSALMLYLPGGAFAGMSAVCVIDNGPGAIGQ